MTDVIISDRYPLSEDALGCFVTDGADLISNLQEYARSHHIRNICSLVTIVGRGSDRDYLTGTMPRGLGIGPEVEQLYVASNIIVNHILWEVYFGQFGEVE